MEDGRVSPDIDALRTWVDELSIARLLVIGEPTDSLVETVTSLPCETRWTHAPLGRMVKGRLAAFRPFGGGPWMATVNADGPAGPARSWTWSSLDPQDPMDGIFHVFDALWPDASSVYGTSTYREGDLVRLVGSRGIGRIKRARRVGDSFEYTVVVDGQDRQVPEASLQLEAGDPKDPYFWINQAPATADSMARTLTWTKIRHPLTDVIYSFRSSRTVFRTYQFRPVLKVINSDNRRLLIADEVGLGKTIEAGLVWNELEQRAEIRSALVVCPSTLRFKWQRELRIRFDRDVPVLSRSDLERWVADLEAGEGRDFQGIVSLELFRTASVLERLEALTPRLDLVIVDEAHYLRNVNTRSNALGALLAEWADALLFLSATPLNLHESDLFNLLHLLDEEAFPSAELLLEQVQPNRVINAAARLLVREGRTDPSLVRRQMRSLVDSMFGRILANSPDFRLLDQLLDTDEPLSFNQVARAKRHLMELHTLAPIFTRTRKVDTSERKAVREPHDRVVHWTDEERDLYNVIYTEIAGRARTSGHPPGFVMQMPLRQAASCLPVIQQRMQGKLASSWSDEDDPDVDDPTINLDFRSVLLRPLMRDSKYDLFLDTVREALDVGSGQALVFSFFRGTLEYLLGRLGEDLPEGTHAALMYGPTPADERERLMNDFRDGKIQVLLCSEVGAEGLDFQFCNVLVNYDLPWNPMRVEQRIGRVDRFGQEADKIFIFNMQVPGTIETDILNRLYARIRVFERTIGDLEPILRELDSAIEKILDPRLTSEQRQFQLEQVAVALEARHQDTEELSTTDSLMNGIGDLLVDGFEEDNPGGGRYIGRDELRSFVQGFLDRVDGQMRLVTGSDATYVVRGGKALAQTLRHQQRRSQSAVNPVTLASLVETDGFTATFDETEAVNRGLQLINVQHPLVGAAVEHFAGDDLLLDRYGVARVPGLDLTTDAVAGIYLVEARGLRPSLELLCVAVDRHGSQLEGVGDAVLRALANDELEVAEADVTLPVRDLFDQIDAVRAQVLQDLNHHGTEANNSLVDRRIAARSREFSLKIDRAEQTLQRVQGLGRAESIVRLNTARVRNLRGRLEEVVTELEAKRGFSVSSTEVAVLLLRP